MVIAMPSLFLYAAEAVVMYSVFEYAQRLSSGEDADLVNIVVDMSKRYMDGKVLDIDLIDTAFINISVDYHAMTGRSVYDIYDIFRFGYKPSCDILGWMLGLFQIMKDDMEKIKKFEGGDAKWIELVRILEDKARHIFQSLCHG